MAPQRTIQLVSDLSKAEKQILDAWPTEMSGEEYRHLQWRAKTGHFLCYEGGQLVSRVSFLKHEVLVGSRTVPVGGVGGVVTVASARNRGHATALFQRLAGYFRDELAVEFGLLFCLEDMIPFYVRRGWQRVSGTVWIDQPSGKLQCPVPAMTLACGDEPWLEGPVDLSSEPW